MYAREDYVPVDAWNLLADWDQSVQKLNQGQSVKYQKGQDTVPLYWLYCILLYLYSVPTCTFLEVGICR